MKTWSSLLFLTLLSLQNLTASSNFKATCGNIEAPSNFKVDRLSTTWADVSWSSVSGASQYLIRTFDRQTGNQIHTVTVSAATTSTKVTWPDMASGSNESKIWSIDAHGIVSLEPASILFDKVILEIVTTGITVNQTFGAGCPLGVNANTCSYFPWANFTQTTYRITGAESPGIFTIEGYTEAVYPIQHVVLRHLQQPPFKYSLNESKTAFIVKIGAQIIATLEPAYLTSFVSPTGQVLRSAGDNFNYTISKVGQGQIGFTSNDENPIRLTERQDISENIHNIAPNPFRDFLTVQTTANATIRLYDLLGALKQETTFAPGQTEVTFQTADLTPGVYFLLIDDGQTIETHKLIKPR